MLRRIRTFIILPIAVLLMGQGCFRAPSAQVTEASKPVTLTWWRVFDDQDSVQPIITAYRALHPNVTVEYRKFRYEEYESELVNALAEDRGPDIMSLHNTWVDKYQTKLAPMPDSYTIPVTTIQGTIKKEKVTTLVTKQGMSIRDLQSQYVDVVNSDVVRSVASDTPQQGARNKIMALPMSADNLALFYNKDLLNAAGIAQPPQFWADFQTDVKKLTRQDAQGNITQAGGGIGTAKNVVRYADILSLLMMQDGARMTDENGTPSFERTPAELSGRDVSPGEEATVFYTDFANPAKEVYSWNDKLPTSLDAFARGQSAFFLGYAFNIADIRTAAPKLNFGIAKVPQIEGNPQVNYANYWVEGVSKKSANQNWAWDFIQFATSAEQAGTYLDSAHKPTALRALIQKQLDDLDLSVFAAQMLTAKSWYRGMNEAAYEQAFADLIDTVLAGGKVHEAINNAVNRVLESYRQ